MHIQRGIEAFEGQFGSQSPLGQRLCKNRQPMLRGEAGRRHFAIAEREELGEHSRGVVRPRFVFVLSQCKQKLWRGAKQVLMQGNVLKSPDNIPSALLELEQLISRLGSDCALQ